METIRCDKGREDGASAGEQGERHHGMLGTAPLSYLDYDA